MLYSVIQRTGFTEVFFSFKMSFVFTVHVKMQFLSCMEKSASFPAPFCTKLRSDGMQEFYQISAKSGNKYRQNGWKFTKI